MTTITEGQLSFQFPDHCMVTKLDAWAFYQGRPGKKNGFKDCVTGNRCVDFAAMDMATKTLWLIEVKDYRTHRRVKSQSIWDETAIKVRASLAGIFAAKVNALGNEQPKAVEFVQASKIRVVLHLEQPLAPSMLFPKLFNQANVTQKLKQLVKPMDAHPLVVDQRQKLGWSVT